MQGKGYIWGQELREITNQSLSNFPIFTQLGGIGLNHELTERQAGFLRDWRKHPRISFTRDLIRNKIAAILSSNSYEQAQQASDLVSFLENNLFMDAASEEEYVNQETLIQRLQTIILNKMCDTKCSQQEDSCLTSSHVTMPSLGSGHGCYNRDLPEPCFQSTDDGSIRSTKCPTGDTKQHRSIFLVKRVSF
ncbi:Histone acetyltransferase [Quillaja saponaria]|uniref:Histone acetyltransferase n=1 Tax=Quillaja saponaria TaxID=32244 RepID=A0AAD7PXX8_QUISA|nr:Histone acetyltransferase [Quillaja saponaria]